MGWLTSRRSLQPNAAWPWCLPTCRGKTKGAKLGFGLWWVKTLMTRLGGSVSVESDGEHGATFRLRLPAT
jgi:C4-dicarboxylate-specific signal transduction histidine kinase